MFGLRIPIFHTEVSARYLKALKICQLLARENFISLSNLVRMVCVLDVNEGHKGERTEWNREIA